MWERGATARKRRQNRRSTRPTRPGPGPPKTGRGGRTRRGGLLVGGTDGPGRMGAPVRHFGPMTPRRCARAFGGTASAGGATRAVVPGHFTSVRYRMGLEPVQARVRNARKRHLCDCRPGWEAKARPRVRSSTHSSQRLVSATCPPLQWSRSSAENSSPRARPPDYDESSARRDHQASAAVIALSASWMPSPTSPAVAAQCKGTRARAPGSQRCSSRVSGSGAVPS